MIFYILSNYYNQKMLFGFSKDQVTMREEIKRNKKFKVDSKNKFSKLVYFHEVKNEEEAIELMELFKKMKKVHLYDTINSFNPQWDNLLI